MPVPTLVATLAFALALPAAAQHRASKGYPFQPAPDGRPGLGVPPDERSVKELFRDPGPEESVWLRELFELAMDVETFVAVAEARYRRLGYFDVFDSHTLEGSSAGLERLERAGTRLTRRPFERAWSSDASEGLARLLVDDTFALRGPLLEEARAEVRELRSAIRLFESLAWGRVHFEEPDLLELLAKRFDLSAARLRALRLDLDALYEHVGAPVPTPDPDLVTALREGDASRGAPRLGSLLPPASQFGRRRASLASSRFDADHRRALDERRVARVEARQAIREMLRLLPFIGVAGQDPPEDMKQIELHRAAAAAGLEGLRADPLATDVYYLLGIALDFCQGRDASTPYFDAYLALRGIRHWQHRTFASRDLTAAEEYALYVVVGWRPPRSDD